MRARTTVFLILDSIFGKQKKTSPAKGGNILEKLAEEVIFDKYGYSELDDTRAVMQAVVFMIKRGDYDSKLYNKDFYNCTDALMLDLVRGRSMSIQHEKIYRARDEVIQALQVFYFYACENLKGYEIHPWSKAALRK